MGKRKTRTIEIPEGRRVVYLGGRLNRSQKWKPAETYAQAREQALEATAAVQHKAVR